MSVHWTQKPENRAKVLAQLRRATRARKKQAKAAPVRRSPESRARMSAAMTASYAARHAAVNGHGTLVPALTGKKLAKATLRALALEGARHRLLALEQERELLLIFLKGAPEL
jgi:hypothetical protein